MNEKEEVVNFFLQKNFLLTPDFLQQIPDNFDCEGFYQKITQLNEFTTILDEELLKKVNLQEKESEAEKEKNIPAVGGVKILNSYDKAPAKIEIGHFINYFKKRYEYLKSILQGRPDLQNAISISKAIKRNSKEITAVIGLVANKKTTKNGNTILTLEDPTGTISVMLMKKNEEIADHAKSIVLDEVVGIVGNTAERGGIYANRVYFPDVQSKEIKKSPDEVYAAFISDLHVGSKMFLAEDFQNFISRINCEIGNEKQKEIAQKIKYLFIIGDLVDGVGIYPEQERELAIKDIEKQYNKCAEYISKIRKDINIIIIGGNHDALRLSEPQPRLNKKFAAKLYELENVTILSNPALVNIHSSENFPGFDILIYHGYSFDYYVANVDSIRNAGGYDRADLLMQLLLQKRHLAPSHASTLYVPDREKDPLAIEKIPDFFVTGHIHKANISSYKNITTICGSCWQSKTAFQEKVGHNPEPSRVPIINLKTRKAMMLKFSN